MINILYLICQIFWYFYKTNNILNLLFKYFINTNSIKDSETFLIILRTGVLVYHKYFIMYQKNISVTIIILLLDKIETSTFYYQLFFVFYLLFIILENINCVTNASY